ncbi:hypothetical protein KSP39_PZI013107 [Platanthera zijinensis]|uniref:Uncharacterized protein n=1 Tax=Platanthera zijinensis TaxID=2320716 RepID=A0AAP0G4A9_9ASPA
MESSTHAATTTVAQRLWRIVRAVFYMLRKGIARRKLMVDLHLLLKCGKLAGKALRNLIHHHHQSSAATRDLHFSDCSCRSGLDQDMLFYDPKGVQLSCSNTPSYGYYNYSHSATKRRSRRRRRDDSYDCYDAAALAKAIEMLNNIEYSSDAESSVVSSALPTPSPMLGIRRTPAVRQLRITDSPFMIQEEDGVDVGLIDKEADEFISRFYEQLRRQKLASAAATPEYHAVRGRKPLSGEGGERRMQRLIGRRENRE